MVLVDTSSWIEALHAKGKPDVRQRVNALIQSGEACWCNMVKLELWNGSRGDGEHNKLREFEEILAVLPINDDVWEKCFDLARNTRSAGLTVPAADVLIAACAFHHDVRIETADDHFRHLEKWR